MNRRKANRMSAKLPSVPGERTFRLLESSDPVVESLLSDATLLGIWDFLRRSPRALSLKELSERVQTDPSAVQRKLELLLAHGLIEAQPARGRRRSITYRVLAEGVTIRFRMPADLERMVRQRQSQTEHALRIMGPSPTMPQSRADLDRHAHFARVMHLSESELAELQRRLDGVAEWIEMLEERGALRGEFPCLCNYGVAFRLEPLAKPSLPQARVRFMQTNGNTTASSPAMDAASGRKRLSSRERQVALALARGSTRSEVAAELGIAQSTVATLTKRIYTKLRVHRRAELVSRLREAFGNGTSR